MHFPLIHTGRRFFFFTFVVEGRRRLCLAMNERTAAMVEIQAGGSLSEIKESPDGADL